MSAYLSCGQYSLVNIVVNIVLLRPQVYVSSNFFNLIHSTAILFPDMADEKKCMRFRPVCDILLMREVEAKLAKSKQAWDEVLTSVNAVIHDLQPGQSVTLRACKRRLLTLMEGGGPPQGDCSPSWRAEAHHKDEMASLRESVSIVVIFIIWLRLHLWTNLFWGLIVKPAMPFDQLVINIDIIVVHACCIDIMFVSHQ